MQLNLNTNTRLPDPTYPGTFSCLENHPDCKPKTSIWSQ